MQRTGGPVAGTGWREVLRLPSLENSLLLLGVEWPVLLHVVPDVPLQVIRVVAHGGHLPQERRHDRLLAIPHALCTIFSNRYRYQYQG